MKSIVFNKWTVIKQAESDSAGRVRYLCRCECGREQIVQHYQLKTNRSKACLFCSHAGVNKTHGMTKTRFYNIFSSIKQRTEDKKTWNYDNYGGRGIKNEWKTFDEFKDDMLNSYTEHAAIHGENNTSIDRIDNDGNYCKENCRWATNEKQSNNRRSCIYVEYMGEKMTVAQLSKKTGVEYYKLHARISKLRWDVERAVKTA